MRPGPGNKKWKTIRSLLRSFLAGATHVAACKAAGISDGTLWRWRQKEPRLDAMINKILESRITHVEDAVYAAALRGNIQSQQYYLNNRARGKWKRDPEVVVNNNQNNNAPTIFPEMKVIFVESKDKIPYDG